MINAIIFLLFGSSYVLIEMLFRGYSHWSMFILGGLCGVLIGLINENTPKMNIFKQMLLGSIIVTVLEFLCGYVINIKLGLNVWDYSNMPFNFMGQVCLLFSFVWFLLSYIVVKLDDYFRLKLEEI